MPISTVATMTIPTMSSSTMTRATVSVPTVAAVTTVPVSTVSAMTVPTMMILIAVLYRHFMCHLQCIVFTYNVYYVYNVKFQYSNIVNLFRKLPFLGALQDELNNAS